MILTRPLRKPFWILSSFVKKQKTIILIAASLGFFIFIFTQSLLPLIPKPTPRKKIGLVGLYSLKTLPSSISQTISRGLTKVDVTSQIQPDIAESWEILEENTIFRFFIKPDILWNDDTLLVSSDLKYDIPNVEVSYPNPKVIEFKLKEPFSPLLTLLSQPVFKNNSVSAGNYTIKKAQYSGSYLKFLELVGKHDKLSLSFYPSNQAAWLGFRLGEVDQLQNLVINPLSDKWYKKVDLIESVNQQQYLAVVFNNKDPQLSVKSLRQALAYATKNKSPNEQNRALTSISPNSWAYNPNVKPYDFSQTQAQELFDKFEQEASLSGQLKINLGTSQSFLSLAETIANDWEEVLPVEIEVKIINSIEPDFQALLINQEIPLDPDQHALWHSTQNSNISNYSGLQIDKLLEDGRKEMDQTTRFEIYRDFQKFIVEDSPAIFLSHPTTYTISRK
jgi:peptide/nickel transport system substrate-binding protein